MFGVQQVIVMVVWQQPGSVFKHPVAFAVNEATPEAFADETETKNSGSPTDTFLISSNGQMCMYFPSVSFVHVSVVQL